MMTKNQKGTQESTCLSWSLSLYCLLPDGWLNARFGGCSSGVDWPSERVGPNCLILPSDMEKNITAETETQRQAAVTASFKCVYASMCRCARFMGRQSVPVMV